MRQNHCKWKYNFFSYLNSLQNHDRPRILFRCFLIDDEEGWNFITQFSFDICFIASVFPFAFETQIKINLNQRRLLGVFFQLEQELVNWPLYILSRIPFTNSCSGNWEISGHFLFTNLFCFHIQFSMSYLRWETLHIIKYLHEFLF